MYTGTDPEKIDLQNQITALSARLAAVDGQGLKDPDKSFVNQTNTKIEGLKTDLKQGILTLQQLLNSYKKSISDFVTATKTQLGLS